MSDSALSLTSTERELVIRLLEDVLAGQAFFSLPEMTTITSWTSTKVVEFHTEIRAGRVTVSVEEQRFLIHALYAWTVSVKKGRALVSEVELAIAKRLSERLRGPHSPRQNY